MSNPAIDLFRNARSRRDVVRGLRNLGIGTVALSSTVMGANLSFRDPGGAAIDHVDLTAAAACPPPATIAIRNTGNVPVTIGAPTVAAPFAAGPLSSSNLGPGASTTHELRASTSSTCTGTANVQYNVIGTSCTATPLALPASLNITGAPSCDCN